MQPLISWVGAFFTQPLMKWVSAFLLLVIGLSILNTAHDYRQSAMTERYRAIFAKNLANSTPPEVSFLERCLGNYFGKREYIRSNEQCNCVNDALGSLGYLNYKDEVARLVRTTILFYEDQSVSDIIDREYISRSISNAKRNEIFGQVASYSEDLCPLSINREKFVNLYSK